MNERELGNRWAEAKEAKGFWICKLPASSTAGIPDWLAMKGVVQLWEAKKRLPGNPAYRPDQLSGAQRFFIRMIARYAPKAGGVLVLGEDGFVEIPAARAFRPMSARRFTQMQEMYCGAE